MQLTVKKSSHWKSLTVLLQDGRYPAIEGAFLSLEPASWFKVQILQSVDVACDTHTITWTMGTTCPNATQPLNMPELVDSGMVRTLMANAEDADLNEIFVLAEALLTMPGRMSREMVAEWGKWIDQQLLPRITLFPNDLPLVETVLHEQKNILKLIDDELVDKSEKIFLCKERLSELQDTALVEIKQWMERGRYSEEFLEQFEQDVKELEENARNNCSNMVRQLELCKTAGNNGSMERLNEEKSKAGIKFGYYLNMRADISRLRCNSVPQGGNSIQTEYVQTRESIELYREARHAISRNRILAVSVQQALDSTVKLLAAGHITTGVGCSIDGRREFDVMAKKKTVCSEIDMLMTLLQNPDSALQLAHKSFVDSIEELVANRRALAAIANGPTAQEELSMKCIAPKVQVHFYEVIRLALAEYDFGYDTTEQQLWLHYEKIFFKNFEQKFIEFYQTEQADLCKKLRLDRSAVDIEELSVPEGSTWLRDFALKYLHENTTSAPSDDDVLSDIVHDINCLEYAYTPLSKLQLLTSALRKSGVQIDKLKVAWSVWQYIYSYACS